MNCCYCWVCIDVSLCFFFCKRCLCWCWYCWLRMCCIRLRFRSNRCVISRSFSICWCCCIWIFCCIFFWCVFNLLFCCWCLFCRISMIIIMYFCDNIASFSTSEFARASSSLNWSRLIVLLLLCLLLFFDWIVVLVFVLVLWLSVMSFFFCVYWCILS